MRFYCTAPLKAWFVNGTPYIVIDDAIEAVVDSVGHHDMTIFKSTHPDWRVRIYKEARSALKDMYDDDTHNFMGVWVTTGYVPFGP